MSRSGGVVAAASGARRTGSRDRAEPVRQPPARRERPTRVAGRRGAEKAAYLRVTLQGGMTQAIRLQGADVQLVDRIPPGEVTFVSDGRDLRWAHSQPIDRRLALEVTAEANPDVAFRILWKPASQNVIYARAVDELPVDGRLAPLMLLLELLSDQDSQPNKVMALALGDAERPEVLLVLGRDDEGTLEPTKMQVWLQPGDSVAALVEDFTRTNRYALDAGVSLYTQEDLLEASAACPIYSTTTEFLGRPINTWLRYVNVGLAAGTALFAAAAIFYLLQISAAATRRQAATEASAAATQSIQQLVVDHQLAFARAASIDVGATLDAARNAWLPGTTVTIRATPAAPSLQVRAPIRRAELGALSVASLDGAERVRLQALLQQAPPAGFERRQVSLSSDSNALLVDLQPQSRDAFAARLLSR